MGSQKSYNRHQAMLGKRPSLLMALEPRILFDGAGADVIADVGTDALLPQDSGPAPEAPAAVDADTADTPATGTAPSADASNAVPFPDASAGGANTASGLADDPNLLTTPELSGQEQGIAANPGTASSATVAAGTDNTGVIADTVSAGTAPVAGNSADTAGNPAGATSTDSGASAGSDAISLTTDSPANDTDQTGGILQLDPVDPVDPLTTTPISQVVFVDTAVNDYQTLVDGAINITDNDLTDTNPTGSVGSSTYTVSGSALVVTLGENPLDDISATLANYTDLSAIHLVSHGDTGQVQIGGATISAQNLDQYTALFAGMGNSLSESGDILLYGCKVGADGTGQDFINAVATLIQADVNASDDATGNAASGGDWDLEVSTGPIEVAALLNGQNVEAWNGLLAAPVAKNDDTTWVVEDSSVEIDVRSNDISDLGTSLTVTRIRTGNSGEGVAVTDGVGIPVNGGMVMRLADGTLRFTPVANNNGVSAFPNNNYWYDAGGGFSFQYRVTDSNGLISNWAIVPFMVRSVNDAPLLVLHEQNFIVNGSFEDTIPSSNTQPPTGWEQGPNSVGVYEYSVPSKGKRSLSLAGSPGDLEIYQTVAGLSAGAEYLLFIDSSNGGTSENGADIFWRGEKIGSLVNSSKWVTTSFTVQAAGDGQDT